ncbi:MAG TPA: NIL domain-containing protein [Fimbriimonadales bacterium]|nr:NIL domain-containing protein [Fimbriimonadales bacterium]
MPISIRLPSALISLTEGRQTIEVSAESVGEAFMALEAACPGLAGRLLDDSGALRRYVNVFVGRENIRNLRGLETPLKNGDELVILPAIAGGAKNDVEKVVLNLVARYDQVKEPWIWRICTDFNVKVNILKANIDEDFGWAQIELEGPIEEVQRCIAWLHTTGLHVEPHQRSVGADAAYS